MPLCPIWAHSISVAIFKWDKVGWWECASGLPILDWNIRKKYKMGRICCSKNACISKKACLQVLLWSANQSVVYQREAVHKTMHSVVGWTEKWNRILWESSKNIDFCHSRQLWENRFGLWMFNKAEVCQLSNVTCLTQTLLNRSALRFS